MLTHFTTVRSQRDTSQLPRPAMPNGVSASSTSLTPTATNSVSLGCVYRQPKCGRRDDEVHHVLYPDVSIVPVEPDHSASLRDPVTSSTRIRFSVHTTCLCRAWR